MTDLSYEIVNSLDLGDLENKCELRTNTVNRLTEDGEKREAQVAILDIEGAIGFDLMKWFEGERQNDSASLNRFLEDLNSLEVEEINVRIKSSPGGIIEDGVAMHDALAKHKAKVVVDIEGYAASIATVIAMAGDEIRISDNARMLAHHAMVQGNVSLNRKDLAGIDESLKEQDNRILNIYSKRGVDVDKLKPYMNANNWKGKWINAANAKAMNMVTEVYEPFKGVNSTNNLQIGQKYMNLFALPDIEANVSDNLNESGSIEPELEEKTMTPEEIAQIASQAAVAAVAEMNKVEDPKEPEAPEAPEQVNNGMTPEEIAQIASQAAVAAVAEMNKVEDPEATKQVNQTPASNFSQTPVVGQVITSGDKNKAKEEVDSAETLDYMNELTKNM